VFQIETNFFEFQKKVRIIGGEKSETRKCLGGIGIATALNQPTRGLE